MVFSISRNSRGNKMNKAEQELKRIEAELESHIFCYCSNCRFLKGYKQGILLGLVDGRKEVFDFIDKNKTNQGSHFLFDEEDYQQFKEDTLGEKE